MKKIATAFACVFLLGAMPVSAADNTTTSFNANGYIISAEETKTTVRITVQSTSPYGYKLVSSSTKKTSEDGMPIRELTVVYDVAPQLNLQQPIDASQAYATTFTKRTIQKIYLTVRTGAATNVARQLIWSQNQQ